MALPSVPEPVASGLLKIKSFTENQFQELVAVLESIPLRINTKRILDDKEINLNTISRDDFNTVRDALLTLYIGTQNINVPVSTYVEDVTEIVRKRGGAEWEVPDESIAQLKERLVRVLSIATLQIVVKAYDILTEHSHTFSTARIMTDIRPVFRESAESSPEAAVIIHMLNLDFSKDGKRQEFVVALDTKDVQQLIDILERAKVKTETLKSVISSTGMAYVEVV